MIKLKTFDNITFSQAKAIINAGIDLADLIGQLENQPDFLQFMGEVSSFGEIDSIIQGGCASGAYMPAVTYYTAKKCMNDLGNEVFEFIENSYGEIPQPQTIDSWDALAVFYCSVAVELWARQFDEVIEALNKAGAYY